MNDRGSHINNAQGLLFIPILEVLSYPVAKEDVVLHLYNKLALVRGIWMLLLLKTLKSQI